MVRRSTVFEGGNGHGHHLARGGWGWRRTRADQPPCGGRAPGLTVRRRTDAAWRLPAATPGQVPAARRRPAPGVRLHAEPAGAWPLLPRHPPAARLSRPPRLRTASPRAGGRRAPAGPGTTEVVGTFADPAGGVAAVNRLLQPRPHASPMRR